MSLSRVTGQQYYYNTGSGDGSGSGSGSGSGTGSTATEGTEEEEEETTTTTTTTERTTLATTPAPTPPTSTCCTPQQLGEIILLIIQLLIIEGVISNPANTTPQTVVTEGVGGGAPAGAIVVPGGPLDQRQGSPSGETILQTTAPSVVLSRGRATLYLDPFLKTNTGLARSGKAFGNLKVKIVRISKRGKFKITINQPESR